MKSLIYIFLILFTKHTYGQDEKISIEVNYGLSGSPRVLRYTEEPTPNVLPEGIVRLADKDFFGTVSQIQINYHLKNETSLSLGYSRDNHQRERNYNNVINNVPVSIKNWAIRHNNNVFFLKHKRNLFINFNNIKYHFGGFVLHAEQQEIDIYEPPLWNGQIEIEERDQPNNGLSDAGFLGGLNFEKKIDKKFIGSINISGYYLATTGTYETTYLTGSLAYNF